ncbi:LOW QUALITY PROTEIN: ankyrin repeat protein [Elysia marginata]|uniref:Ankyrin repeat protein n=1 Tax=Elysia marginata TaxID=1093978 RepID=A0AAV4HJU4_9GAST|nr:LOW QUALITY PROTEIN: ankyrin repeat protein [Elysia marginata]
MNSRSMRPRVRASKRKVSCGDNERITRSKKALLSDDVRLNKAIDRSDFSAVKEILEGRNQNVSSSKTCLQAALLKAAEEGKKQIVQLLLSYGGCVKGRSKIGCLALIAAAKRGYLDIVKLLIKKGAPVNGKDSSGKTALMAAVKKSCCSALITFLLEGCKADVNLQDNEGKTALMLAVEQWDYETVQILFLGNDEEDSKKCSCDESIKDKYGRTALDFATMNGSAELMNILSESRKESCSPLSKAAAGNNLGLVRWLVEIYPSCVESLGFGEPPLAMAMLGLNCDVESWDGKIHCDFELMDFLLQAGVNVNDCHSCGYTALMFAATAGSERAVKALLSHKASLSKTAFEKNLHGQLRRRTALMMAAQKGWVNVVELLIEAGADFDLEDEDGESAFILAIKSGHKACVEALLKHQDFLTDSDVHLMVKHKVLDVLTGFENIWDHLFGGTRSHKLQFILCKAIEAGCYQLVKAIKHGADVNFRHKYRDLSHPLFLALKDNEMVSILLAMGADINLCLQDTGQPALMHAIKENNVPVVQTLLRNNANMYGEYRGSTALTLACCGNKIDIVLMLLDAGMDVNHVSGKKQTALWVAVENKHYALAEILIKRGANVNIATTGNVTILMHALRHNTAAFSELIIKSGADVNAADSNGDTALFSALNRHTQHKGEKVALLLRHGADINHSNLMTKTPLMIAAALDRNLYVFKLLLASGPDVNAQDLNGNTALHVAVESRGEDKLKDLVSNGADMGMINSDNRNPLMLAFIKLRCRIIKALLELGAKPDIQSSPNVAHPNSLDNILLKFSFNDNHDFLSYDLFLDCLEVLLKAGCSLHGALQSNIDKFLCTAIFENKYKTVQLLVQSGVAPNRHSVSYLPGKAMFILDSHFVCDGNASPLCTAILANRPKIISLLAQAFFLHPHDVQILQHPRIVERLESFLLEWPDKDSSTLQEDLFPKNWSLYKWSKLAVLNAVGYGEGRAQRVEALPIPQRMKDNLLFKDISCKS